GAGISVEQIEVILSRRPELARVLGEGSQLSLRKIAEEIHASIAGGTFDASNYIQLRAARGALVTGNIEAALEKLSIELYADPGRVAEALRADQAIVDLIGDAGITRLANRIAAMAKQGNFDLQRFLQEAETATGDGTDALTEAFLELGQLYEDKPAEYFSNLYIEWQESLAEGGNIHNFVDYLRENGEKDAAEKFAEYMRGEDVPERFSRQNFIQMVDMTTLPEDILGPETATFIAGLSADEQAELTRQLGTVFGDGIVSGAGVIPAAGMSAWQKFVLGAGMSLNVASAIYAISGFISTADLAKQGKTVQAALTGLGATAFGLWAVTGSIEVLGPVMGASAALVAAMPWLGLAFGVISMGALVGNFIYSNLPSTKLAEKRDFLAEGVGNGRNYLIVAPHDKDDLPDEIRDIDGTNGIRPFVPNAQFGPDLKRPVGNNDTVQDIMEDNPLLANLSPIDKEFLKYGYAERYAKDQFGKNFEVTFHGVGDFETDPDAAYRAALVLEHIENYDASGNKITNSKDAGNNRIDGWTRENRNDPRSEAKPHTEAGRFQDFIKYGWGTLKGGGGRAYDPLSNGSQSNSEWKGNILQDNYTISYLMDHYFSENFSQ
ncbi:MAG: hypothetical protein H7X97_08095, partial [Opitutaceae bacterium]|nr:hypothetical protein [Verrucomicrobiales bacterium]